MKEVSFNNEPNSSPDPQRDEDEGNERQLAIGVHH